MLKNTLVLALTTVSLSSYAALPGQRVDTNSTTKPAETRSVDTTNSTDSAAPATSQGIAR